MSNWKFRCGDAVRHNFSNIEGRIIDTRVDPNSYCYQVVWEGSNLLDEPDWYQDKVLLKEEVNE